MNTKMMLKVADAIERHPQNFSLNTWFGVTLDDNFIDEAIEEQEGLLAWHEAEQILAIYAGDKDQIIETNWCNTTACIAGWTVTIDAHERGSKTIPGDQAESYHRQGQKLLDLTPSESDQLFYTGQFWYEMAQVEISTELTAKKVAKVLRGLVDGTVRFLERDEFECFAAAESED